MAIHQSDSAPSATTLSIEVFSDFICPWCYLGHRRLASAREAVRDALTIDVLWLPFELNPDMPPEGRDRRAYRSAKFGSWEKSRELDEGTVAAGAPDGVEFRYDLMRRTPNTLPAHRLVWAARNSGLQDALVERLLRAYFTEGRDISEAGVLADVAGSVGLPDDFVADVVSDEDATRQVREQEARAQSVGLRGVPHYVLDRRFAFSGAVPTEELVRLLQQVAAERGAGA